MSKGKSNFFWSVLFCAGPRSPKRKQGKACKTLARRFGHLERPCLIARPDIYLFTRNRLMRPPGHDGIFRLPKDHPEAARIRALLREAIPNKASVWFVARKPDLALLDVLAVG